MDNRIVLCQRLWIFNERRQLDGLRTPKDRFEYAPANPHNPCFNLIFIPADAAAGDRVVRFIVTSCTRPCGLYVKN